MEGYLLNLVGLVITTIASTLCWADWERGFWAGFGRWFLTICVIGNFLVVSTALLKG